MTKVEMMQRIDELKGQRFMLAMKDRWTASDYETDRQWSAEVMRLQRQVEQES